MVAIEANGGMFWQRPVGGVAGFELRDGQGEASFSDPPVEIVVSMYDAAGRLLYLQTHRF